MAQGICLYASIAGEDPGLWLRHGVLSSRRLVQKWEEAVACRALAPGNWPQHPALYSFWWRHRADFGAVVRQARDLGLVSLDTLGPDSTKVRANAGKRRAISNGCMQQEEALDTSEDAQFGMDLRGDEVPAVLQPREGRRARREDNAPEQMQNLGLRELHHATSQAGFQHCYNARLVMDAGSQLMAIKAVLPGPRPRPAARVGSVADFRRGLNLHHLEYRDSGS